MFGTIGHVRPKPGHENAIQTLMDEWQRTIRPSIPGEVVQFMGRPKDNPDEVVFLALVQDEQTYRNLAASPEQDAFFRRLMEHCEGEPRWEDVQMEMARPA